ncbi:glycosyltransferase [Aliiglaciecola litoralis]|uniref:Glycosyltransferase 2-like domain-containing protein n=1 Tax=Aliiglaciecola litoralis TaxID=582857 RepID=A0ABN1LIG2_9ALTE
MVKTIALLMPSLNEEDSVALTLDSIFQSSRLPDEIIVADGGSSDRTLEIVQQYSDRGVELKIVKNPEVYAGAGRNRAFEVSNSDILMLMDFGNCAAPDWIEKMAVPFEQDPDMDFVSGAFLPQSQSDFEHVVACILYHSNSLMGKIPLAELMKQMPKDHSPGALSLAISRTMWEKLDGMPGWLRAAEDKLFGRKMMTFKPRYCLLPDAKISHHMRSTSWQVFEQMKVYSRGNLRTRLVHKHVAKIMLMYIGLLISIPFIINFPPSILPVSFMAALYVWKSGVSKVKKVDGRIHKKAFIFYASQIVLARDLGILAGSILGWGDWLFKPEFKRKFESYVRDTELAERPLSLE